MCGIIGIIKEDLTHYHEVKLDQVLLEQSHRGPDDWGKFVDYRTGIYIGHNRLSIIDLSEKGHQPMTDESKRFVVSFNGEIYNYKELRGRLLKRGITFFSESDTEIILKSFMLDGINFIESLRGMFAIAIWDNLLQELYLVRDRFGIKPLYYFFEDNHMIFASEIRTLLKTGFIDKNIDRDALMQFLHSGDIFQPATLIKNIKCVPPSTFLHFKKDEVTVKRYYDFLKNCVQYSNEFDPEQFKEVLLETVNLHYESDVEVGTFLSGGIDSTLLATSARALKKTIRTFSLGFEDDEQQDELFTAAKTAKIVGARHFEYRLTENDIIKNLNDLLNSYDQPSLDGANSYFISKFASKYVKVGLTGHGLDELLAGYPIFETILNSSLLRDGNPILYSTFNKIRNYLPGRFFPLYNQVSANLDSNLNLIANYRTFLTRNIGGKILNKEIRHLFLNFDKAQNFIPFQNKTLSPIEELSHIELSTHLSNTFLRDTDFMSMHHSLEIRPPFLDHKFAEICFSIPGQLKIAKRKKSKIVVREYLQNMIPKFVLDQQKRGFVLPLKNWINRYLREAFLDLLNSTPSLEIFNKEFIHVTNRDFNSLPIKDNRIWGILVLLHYLYKEKLNM